ncbi:IclR family transcriptional regulator [Rhodococcus sp. NPDC058481]|uniref:IclR family transcriptional regulator n=1 Tax=unclassified Rhodococcus (in: high G+C Gram-positive bacteria) TaxID=192944 RepID=UPI00365AA670
MDATMPEDGSWRTTTKRTPRARESLLERVTMILDSFTGPNLHLSLDDLATRSGLPRSTTHRIVVEMIELGWLTRRGRNYRLGSRALGAVGPDAAHARIRIGANDILQDLHLRTGMVVHLGVLDDGQEYFLDKVGGPFGRLLRSRVGARYPAYRGAGGRSLLALLAPEEVDQVVVPQLHSSGSRAWTRSTLHAELARIRVRGGVAFESTEASVGDQSGRIGSLGCAVRTGDGVAVSLCLAGDGDAVQLDRLVPLVRDAATRLARAV